MRRALLAGAAYVAVVFVAGFVLGVLRTLVLEPALGAVAAVLVELPVMLAIAWATCARMRRRWPVTRAESLVMGGFAFVLLMALEAGVSVGLAGRSLAAHWALYGDTAHRLGLAGQVAFALFPLVQAWRAGPARGGRQG